MRESFSKLFIFAFLGIASTTGCFRLAYDGDAKVSAYPASFPTDLVARAVGDCKSGTLAFTQIVSSGIQLYGSGDSILIGQVEAEMHTDSSYMALYREFDSSGETFRQTLNGTYSYDSQSGHVVLSNFGNGNLDTDEGKWILIVQPQTVVNSPLLLNRVLEFHQLKASDTLTNQRSQICP